MYGWPTGSHQLATILWSFFLSSPIAFASSTQLLCRWAILATGHNAQNLPLITKSVLNEFTPAGLQWHGLNESKCSSWKLKYISLYEPSLHHFPTLVPTVPALVPNGMAKVTSLACCMCFPHQGSTEYSQDIPWSHHGYPPGPSATCWLHCFLLDWELRRV